MIEHEGKLYARASEIIQPFTNFTGIDSAVLERKAQIGTKVHKAISDDLSDEFPMVDPLTTGYFQSYHRWKELFNPTVIRCEERYFCDEKMITGQIDALIGDRKDCKTPILVDFKTSAQESKITWPMQAHLYSHLLNKNGIAHSKIFLFIKLNKNGTLPQVFEYFWNKNTHAKCMKAIEDFWSKQ